MRTCTRLGLPALSLTLLAGLVACTGAEEPDQPDQPDVAAVAGAYADGDFSAVDLDGVTPEEAGKERDRILADLGDLEPEVTASEPTVHEGTARAELTWTWPVGGTEWEYETDLSFTRSGGTWRLEWEPATVHPELAGPHDRLLARRLLAQRGPVLGAGDQRLVEERPVVTYGIDKARVADTPAAVRSGRLLARLLGIDTAAFVERIRSAGPSAFVEAVTYRRGETPVPPGRESDILGALTVEGTRMLAPTKEFAAPLLGTVGPVTAEVLKKSPDAYAVGDEAGLSGLQARYDELLRGTPGVTIDVIHGEDGTEGSEQVFRVPPQHGRPLRLTLDRRLQTLAEDVLADTGPASALVAVRPSDGAVLAAASGPGSGGVNTATFAQAPPGSTFKTATTLALLRHGVTPQTTISCPPTITVDGKRFRNDSWYPAAGLGQVSLTTALAHSCNTAMIGQADEVSHDELAAAAATLGFGIDHDLGFPAYFGQVPDPAGETGHAAELIGQGQVLASPMVMAAMIGSIQAGRTVVPQLVTGVDGLETEVPDGVEPMTGREAAQLRSVFRAVVTDGTGRGLADVPGGPVIAKTGTAEFDRDGRRLTHTWMIAAQGDLAVAVFVDAGENGASTSGPLLERFLRER